MKRSNPVQTRAQQYIPVLLHRITPRAPASAKTDWDWIRRLTASAPYAQHRPPLSFDYARNTVRSTGYAQSTEYGRQTPSIILLFPNGDLSEEEKTKKKKKEPHTPYLVFLLSHHHYHTNHNYYYHHHFCSKGVGFFTGSEDLLLQKLSG